MPNAIRPAGALRRSCSRATCGRLLLDCALQNARQPDPGCDACPRRPSGRNVRCHLPEDGRPCHAVAAEGVVVSTQRTPAKCPGAAGPGPSARAVPRRPRPTPPPPCHFRHAVPSAVLQATRPGDAPAARAATPWTFHEPLRVAGAPRRALRCRWPAGVRRSHRRAAGPSRRRAPSRSSRGRG